MKRMTLCVLILGLVFAAPVSSEERDDEERDRPKDFGVHGWGLRFGVGDDPDQIIGGVQFDHGEFKWVHLEPNIELLIGDDHTTLSGFYAVHFRFRHVHGFRPYIGTGLGLAIDYFDHPVLGDDTDVDIGFRLIGGTNWAIKNGRELFLEVSLGLGYVNDVQLMGGWSF